ncbi:MAG TPA: MBOAT family O-acyltransferase [Gemmatimonadaceae bacterium]|jgi:D-alanyl-lipoteichoic acid acyltransferase DltB (MBOAT superfamily)|nr:MBOAT family O-acyltransferase [Gemmatimonadaceae bacterium]
MSSLYVAFAVGIPILWLLTQRVESARVRQVLYLVASYAFYLSVGWRFFGILLASSLFNYAWGSVVRRKPTASVLWVGILANVLLLSTFKYLPALAGLFEQSPIARSIAHLALPIGISFWTFQGLSYLFDQYRGENLDPTLVEFLLYMGFAPTVLSGPICRLPELLPQFRSAERGSWQNVAWGAQSIWIGVLMITVARYLGSGWNGQGVNWGFESLSGRLSSADTWVLLIAYGLQLFFDFAGYSRVVIGLAMLFGIRLPENFRRPFLSPTPAVFWTRWHITLSFWIRDYLFLPIATMRREVWWRNTMLVASMVIFGLWHKASLLFLLWGTYQGLLLLAHRLIQQWQRRTKRSVKGPVGTALSWLVTFAAITLGWILFRARDWNQAGSLLASALNPFSGRPSALPSDFYALVAIVAVGYVLLEWLTERLRGEGDMLSWLPIELRYLGYATIFYFTVFHSAEPQSFIYFQF